ncbi:unnamed protein product [Protopolystoma xenopodis]|uniref:Dynein heavy chain coiled coil stalk domain-containing protein n=1 Tax=Protopolystoma xenopodis TaxID=117903 RepID=A0A3S4ZDD4_9PLAT|nr:unnamed protein product [Protopolystoma xenopodis]
MGTGSEADAEEALAEAMPALEAARKALDELDKNDVTEIRAFATPPGPVSQITMVILASLTVWIYVLDNLPPLVWGTLR